MPTKTTLIAPLADNTTQMGVLRSLLFRKDSGEIRRSLKGDSVPRENDGGFIRIDHSITDELEALGDVPVEMRVTLSYFI